jgi:hypothetical protein
MTSACWRFMSAGVSGVGKKNYGRASPAIWVLKTDRGLDRDPKWDLERGLQRMAQLP